MDRQSIYIVILNGDADPIHEEFRRRRCLNFRAGPEIRRISRRGTFAAGVLVLSVVFTLFFVSQVSASEASNPSEQNLPGNEPSDSHKLGKEQWVYADVIGTYNPRGLDLSGGYEYRDSYRYDSHYDSVSSYWQAGTGLDINPSYAQPSVGFEWMPVLFFIARLQFDGYYYFGQYGGLLSFSSGTAPFGDQVRQARRGTEETAVGGRLFFQPTIQLKFGDIVFRNQSDIARYWFSGKGPFFLELEYDTLLKDGDNLFANRTQALKEISRGPGNGSIYFGPYYELVHAKAADLTRQRIGLLFYSERNYKKESFDTGHFFTMVGYDLEDRNRGHEIYFLIGFGGTSVIK